jgi:very-short-patch-repair endonuclease
VARTLVDLGAVTSTRTVETLVHRACQRGLTTVDELVGVYLAVSRRGRRGCGAMSEVLQVLDPLVQRAESELELVLLTIIRDHGLPLPVVQYEVDAGGRSFRLDVAYPEHRLFIEGDGFGVHGTRSAFESDRWRQNLLVLEGWRVLRFTWRQLLERPGEVAAQIRGALRSAA